MPTIARPTTCSYFRITEPGGDTQANRKKGANAEIARLTDAGWVVDYDNGIRVGLTSRMGHITVVIDRLDGSLSR